MELFLFALLYIAIGICSIAFGRSVFDIYYRNCDIIENGILIKYPFEEQRMIPWGDFKEVCLCYMESYNGRDRLQEKRPVLCFVRYGERKNHYGYWKMENPLHYRNVIYMDYTQERYLKIVKYYQKAIIDMRGVVTYFDNTIEKELK